MENPHETYRWNGKVIFYCDSPKKDPDPKADNYLP